MRRIMVLDPPAAPSQVLSDTSSGNVVPAKVRIRFHKGGDLRFLSHHDLMRTFERMLRRADLPMRRTQGFHPKPRLVFALSLPLGVVGLEEAVELELSHALPSEEIRTRLTRQAPPGLIILSVRSIDFRVTAHVCRLCYRVRLLPHHNVESVRSRAAEVLALPELRVVRTERSIDLRSSLQDLRILEGNDTAVLEIYLRPMPAGTARPEEVLHSLALNDLMSSGAVLERCLLELDDEIPPPSLFSDAITSHPEKLAAETSPIAEGIA